ncbi:MAG: DUF1501 domain-containing protein [Zavarzinella sp.]
MLDLLNNTRRHFFRDCGIGLGSAALASLLEQSAVAGPANPQAVKPPHHTPKAKAVIFLFMAGGPSQFELFDPKPELQKFHGKPIPESFVKGKRFAFMSSFAKDRPKLLGTKRKFQKYGQTGSWVSDCFPNFTRIVDDVTFVRSIATDVFNHGPAKLFFNTGSPQFGRPSMGSWVTYGIGSESQDLPGFVVLQSGPRGPRGGVLNWGSGFLPTSHQGVPFRGTGDPIINLSTPSGISANRQQSVIDAVKDLNKERFDATKDPEIQTRIASYEMAYRMQTSAPELIDLSKENKKTLEAYGAKPGDSSFANNCLLARRLVERGVRFVQLYHTDWDHHGDAVNNLDKGLDKVCRDVDQPMTALVEDLKRTGLLDSTLVIWGGEFGRTPMGEVRNTVGRNHHIDSFTMWFTGGGIKRGISIGETDEFGFSPTEDRVHVHDIQATVLHLLGLDHKKLTYRFQGRDFRLTDVHGHLINKLMA